METSSGESIERSRYTRRWSELATIGAHPDQRDEGVGRLGPEDPRADDREVTRREHVVRPEVADGPVVEVGRVVRGVAPCGSLASSLEATRLGAPGAPRDHGRRDPRVREELVDRPGDAAPVDRVGVHVAEEDEGGGRGPGGGPR